jgi:hypothetical protein
MHASSSTRRNGGMKTAGTGSEPMCKKRVMGACASVCNARSSWDTTNMWPSCEETTDAHGVVQVPRDMFLVKSSRQIKGGTLRSPARLGLEDALFSVQLPPPPDSDDVILVSVKTKPQ